MTSQQAMAVAALCRTLFLTNYLEHLKKRASDIHQDTIDYGKWAVIYEL
jgi:hypothetical protein